MNKQEIEENIAILKSMIPEYERKNRAFGVKALREAISALEKQIPKKPITHDKTNRADCPICEVTVRGINKPYGDYCSGCGQKLDWSVEE